MRVGDESMASTALALMIGNDGSPPRPNVSAFSRVPLVCPTIIPIQAYTEGNTVDLCTHFGWDADGQQPLAFVSAK